MPSSPKTQHSLMNNVPKASSFTRNDSSKLLLPECKLSLKASASDLNSEAPTLLQRMGLGNQMLMVRLGLPLKAPPSPTPISCSHFNQVLDNRVAHSNELVRKRDQAGGLCLELEQTQGGGGAPWKDANKDILSISDKTHLLCNAYAANIK